MAKREKTTKAENRTMRINPETSQQDADTLAIIKQLEAQGYNFKQIAQDAILRANGHQPEMYSKNPSGFILGSIEDMLSRFASEVISNVRGSGGRGKSEEINDEEDVTPFANKLAQSFIQRQKTKGNE